MLRVKGNNGQIFVFNNFQPLPEGLEAEVEVENEKNWHLAIIGSEKDIIAYMDKQPKDADIEVITPH